MSEHDQLTTNAVREARRSLAALLDHLPEAVWREHKGTVENAIAMLAEQAAGPDREEREMASRAVAALLVFRNAEGYWHAKAQARGVTKHIPPNRHLVNVMEMAETFIVGPQS